MCTDLRNLNALTKKDAFPLPRLDLALHRAAQAKVFSKIDLASGFHQIEVYPPIVSSQHLFCLNPSKGVLSGNGV